MELIRKISLLCSTLTNPQEEVDSYIASLLEEFQNALSHADFRHPAVRFKGAVQKVADSATVSWLAVAETLLAGLSLLRGAADVHVRLDASYQAHLPQVSGSGRHH